MAPAGPPPAITHVIIHHLMRLCLSHGKCKYRIRRAPNTESPARAPARQSGQGQWTWERHGRRAPPLRRSPHPGRAPRLFRGLCRARAADGRHRALSRSTCRPAPLPGRGAPAAGGRRPARAHRSPPPRPPPCRPRPRGRPPGYGRSLPPGRGRYLPTTPPPSGTPAARESPRPCGTRATPPRARPHGTRATRPRARPRWEETLRDTSRPPGDVTVWKAGPSRNEMVLGEVSQSLEDAKGREAVPGSVVVPLRRWRGRAVAGLAAVSTAAAVALGVVVFDARRDLGDLRARDGEVAAVLAAPDARPCGSRSPRAAAAPS